jgi:hypothetical protein
MVLRTYASRYAEERGQNDDSANEEAIRLCKDATFYPRVGVCRVIRFRDDSYVYFDCLMGKWQETSDLETGRKLHHISLQESLNRSRDDGLLQTA